MLKIRHIITVSIFPLLMAGCVTKNYENNSETPVIENTSTDNEIALTRISLGMGYLNMGNTTQAKLNLEKAKRYAPNLTQVYTAFAQYYDTVDEPEQAIEAFEKALSLDPDDADTLNNFGVFLCKREQYKESERVLLKAIAVPSYLLVSQSYENLALCQLEDKNFDKAEMYLAKSISHSPGRAAALYQMLRLQYAMGNYSEAAQYLSRYEKSVRRFNPSALGLAYKVYEKMNKRRIAKNYASLLVEMFPNSYEANQYILNGLRRIEADNLADEYLILRQSKNKNKKTKKRVMVLSPNAKSGISLSSKNQSKKSSNKSSKKLLKETVDSTSSKLPIKEPELVETADLGGKLLISKPANTDNELPFGLEVETTNIDVIETSSQPLPKLNDSEDPESTISPENDVSLLENIESTGTNDLINPDEVKQPEKDETLSLVDESDITQGSASVDESGNRLLTIPVHVIEVGDSLFSISKRYNIKMYQIERWNGFKRSKILKIGDVIYLADPKKVINR